MEKNDSKRGTCVKGKGYNLLVRFQDRKEGILLVLKIPWVPFTNNVAERDLRMDEGAAKSFKVLANSLGR
ncbi:hypothetical protein HCUR_01078 [Holospora curviuscula]|uniref:Transposase IS66 central domain-containing protein n=1 Tax=Holospora curviuscula TaxID=1082868 RepID=A0A2S5R8L3_9PROT|nr:hypothetical protein HCUR_01078 [Holospora curviuscula]